jgi:hypothetical protein
MDGRYVCTMYWLAIMRDWILRAPFPLSLIAWVLRLFLGERMTAVYLDQHTLRRVFSDRWLFARPKRPVYGLWLTGEGVLRDLEVNKHGIRRLVLPHPETPGLAELEATAGQRYNLPETIEQMTEHAQSLGIEVLWYRKSLPTVHLTFGNPDSWWRRWVHVEPLLPHMASSEHPHFRVTGWRNRRVFRAYWRTFNKICSASEPAPPKAPSAA